MCEVNIIEILGKNMHDIRLKKNISLKQLSEKLNIDIKKLKELEKGKKSTISFIDYNEIAKALGVSFEEFTEGISFVD